jgi:hypothetical protein
VGRARSQAFNVTAEVGGSRSDLEPLVIMTPRSGWWQCASERGGGLACWLEAIRVVADGKPARDCFFVALSGHELGGLGIDAYMERRKDLIKRAYAWIHFGANIGATAAAEPASSIGRCAGAVGCRSDGTGRADRE